MIAVSFTTIICINIVILAIIGKMKEDITTLTESYSSALSNTLNDIADMELKILGEEVDTSTMEHMRDKRVLNIYIDDLEPAKIVEYLQKSPDSSTFIKETPYKKK